LDTVEKLLDHVLLEGWRKVKDWHKKMKKLYRKCSNIHRKKGKNYVKRLQKATGAYLDSAIFLLGKIDKTLLKGEIAGDIAVVALKTSLESYKLYTGTFIDLVDRRIMQGEKIPHGDKLFSIFEPHVEWLSKGKEGRPVELGHNVLLTTDQYHFIVDHEVVIKKKDAALVIPLALRLEERFGTPEYKLESISFDRGFFSGPAKKVLQGKFGQVVMPKPGNKSEKIENEEGQTRYIKLRQKHSAVESNINELECGGAGKVPDKGLDGFKDYVAWSVVAYNLKRLGRIVLAQQRQVVRLAA